jgi:serine/threonine protein phosphatase 1
MAILLVLLKKSSHHGQILFQPRLTNVNVLTKLISRLVGDKKQTKQCNTIVAESTACVARFKRNTLGRDFVVADIHGAFDLLVIAMAEVDFDPDVDRIFSTGDLIDRGDSSHRCIEFIALPYFHSVLGNHESMLLDLYIYGDPPQHVLEDAAKHNGFEWWLGIPNEKRHEILEAIRTLPYAMEVESACGIVGLIHADVPKKMKWDDFIAGIESGDAETIDTCLWGRERIDNGNMRGISGIARVFVGHSPQWQGLTRFGNVYALDTGAAFGLQGKLDKGHFTMVKLDADESRLLGGGQSGAMIDIR